MKIIAFVTKTPSVQAILEHIDDATREIKSQALLDEFVEIMEFVQAAFQQGGTAHGRVGDGALATDAATGSKHLRGLVGAVR